MVLVAPVLSVRLSTSAVLVLAPMKDDIALVQKLEVFNYMREIRTTNFNPILKKILVLSTIIVV